MGDRPNLSGFQRQLLDLAMASWRADTYDTCGCVNCDDSCECPACVHGEAWRASYVGILDAFGVDHAALESDDAREVDRG